MNNKVKFLRGTATEYESSTKDNDTFYYTTDDEKLYLGNKEITGGGVTVDDTLSDTSKNPVQNKVINAALNSKANLSDIPTMLPANGGNADTVGGKHANELVQFIGKINSATIANNPNYATAYEGNLAPATAVEIGLDSAWYHLKYFKHEDIGTVGWGVQIAIPLTNITILPKYRCAANNETSWSKWYNFADGGNAATATYSSFANNASTLADTTSNVCLRDIYAGTSDMTAGTTALKTGAIYLVYE